MAKYTIFRIYEIPATNRIEAAERMMEALVLRTEKDYHIRDIIRDPGVRPGEGKPVVLTPPAGWLTLVLRQLTSHK